MQLKELITEVGEIILYSGTPNLKTLSELAKGNGDIWHSSFEQGYKNAFDEIIYQTFGTDWYTYDFDNLDLCISWRINPYNFAVRKSVWEKFQGCDLDFTSSEMQALSLGFDIYRNGGIPYYCKGLFIESSNQFSDIPIEDIYIFYRKKFKAKHSNYLLARKGIFNIRHWRAFRYASLNFKMQEHDLTLPVRKLEKVTEKKSVSFIIPTMLRQEMTCNLLNDIENQTYHPTEVIVVDATPEDKRDETLYDDSKYSFKLIVKWQTSKGSCRARNEAIDLCSGDYIIFGDDDIRILPNYIENHIRFLQTYKARACNGLDIQADNFQQDLDDLKRKIAALPSNRLKAGITSNFSNANSCVERKFVNQLIGNDINFDGGYGEDSDFGLSLVKNGVTVLYNPFAINLHLKPPAGGYRFWGTQSKITGKKRKVQPWELSHPVGIIRPVPSPTIMYGIMKQFNERSQREYRMKYFLNYFVKGKFIELPFKLLKFPIRLIQFKKSVFYAKNLLKIGVRHK
jgi:glycosyltransferase involved in cell wall biosynthesis